MFDLEKRYRENNVSECFDFLAIYDGPSSISPFLFKPTCELPKDMQKNLPITFHSSFHTLEAYFESDHSDAYGGFELKYRSIEHDCGGIWMSYATPSELSYESWKTTTRTHQKRKRCRFFIKSVKNEPIELNFQQFSFPSKTPDCVDEYLEIRDVGMIAECQHPSCATTQSEVGNGIRICGGNTPSRFVSKTSLVQIVASVVLQSQYSATCNRTISIKTGVERWASGQISSPNYPKAYDDNATCITKVEAPKDYQIFLTFHLFSMERGTRRVIAPNGTVVQRYGYGLGYRAVVTCEFDNLTIYYNETTPTQNETYCGWSGPPSQLTPNNTLFLKLITDGTNGMVGYNAYYYAVKVVEDRPYHKFYNFAPIYEPSGYLSNLGYPGYPQNTTQRWTVIPPSGMSCTVKILTSMSKVRSCSTNEKVKWAHYIGSMPEQWIDLPCYNPYPRDAYNLTAGERMMFEITTDKYAYNNGIGLRVFWNCINAGTPVFTVDEWESETY
ncbi:hypothetical protein M3Y97_01115000 [Aphelenchoides bicaudatus]|nr:hypothetical protein M3Y97_01115000 [Aphelenchoides bicaudatus]